MIVIKDNKDKQLKTKVMEQLYWNNWVNGADIVVIVNSGKAILTGRVPSFQAKQIIESHVKAVLGSTEVDNQLKVLLSSNISVSTDDTTALNVINALIWDSEIDAIKIDISVIGGVTTLRGTVDAHWKKFEAENLAYAITGVIDVVNKLAVVPTKKSQDEEIARNIEDALERNINIKAEDVSVIVENGRVTLTGYVYNWAASRVAFSTASHTKGVIKVINALAIRYLDEGAIS